MKFDVNVYIKFVYILNIIKASSNVSINAHVYQDHINFETIIKLDQEAQLYRDVRNLHMY